METFSFHDLPPVGDPQLIPTLIGDMKNARIAECEIMSGHVEPMGSYATRLVGGDAPRSRIS